MLSLRHRACGVSPCNRVRRAARPQQRLHSPVGSSAERLASVGYGVGRPRLSCDVEARLCPVGCLDHLADHTTASNKQMIGGGQGDQARKMLIAITVGTPGY